MYRKHYTFSIFRDLYNFSTWSNLGYINLSKSFINSNSIFINLQKFSCVTFRIVFLHEFFFFFSNEKDFLKLYEEIFFSNRTKISYAFKFVRVRSFNVSFFRCCKKYSLITRYCGQHSLENFNNFSLMFDSKLKSEKKSIKINTIFLH